MTKKTSVILIITCYYPGQLGGALRALGPPGALGHVVQGELAAGRADRLGDVGLGVVRVAAPVGQSLH
jgi:hypothetical protein